MWAPSEQYAPKAAMSPIESEHLHSHQSINWADERWVGAALAAFLPNRYTRTDEELLGKNLLGVHAVAHFTRGDPMPKVPTYTLAWSSAREIYELYQTRDRGILSFIPGSPEWFAWLEQVSSFAFVGKSNHYTARKEAKQRGGRYWYAYLTTGEHLTKKYLGKTADLSLARLEHIAGILRTQSATQTPPPASLSAAGTDGEMETAQPPLLAQQRHPLHPLLATKLYVPRPRTHLIPRAHLVERLQQGVERALTLVSGPAGFGKTTLLAQWFAQSGMPVA